MTLDLTYDDGLARVRVSVSEVPPPVAYAVVQRTTDEVRWTTVRGATDLHPTGGTLRVDDYEFTPDVVNHYRVRLLGSDNTEIQAITGPITPHLDRVWLKSIAKPFLNQRVTVVDWTDTTRPSRAAVFDVAGRSFPVAVSEARGSRRWTIQVFTQTMSEAESLDLLLASGDALLVQVPASWPARGGYVSVGETTEVHPQRGSVERLFSLPLVEVAAPGPDVVGSTSTWQTVLNTFATWDDVLAAYGTWADLMELVGSPADVIVP